LELFAVAAFGNRESSSGFAHAAEIKNAHTKRNHVREEGRNGRDQSTDSRGNAHCGRKNVIGKERSRGEQAGRCAEIEARYGESHRRRNRPAMVWRLVS
jgi:hypothetical protein